MIRGFGRTALLASAVLGLVWPEAVRGQSAGKVGEVSFPISCTTPAQQQFTRAVALLHSFWYEEAAKAFTGVTATDPSCAMGYWGVAMSAWHPLWYPPDKEALKEGAAAAARAEALDPRSDRERAYIQAIAAFYRDYDRVDNRNRSLAYEKAMEQLHQSYPDDREAAVFYALALDTTASPTDKSYANQRKAASILKRVFDEQPNHPGAAHYLIHSYDAPGMAQLGLPAAICYADIAPAVPHALHMPSHIFTRVGQWPESIGSNSAAATAGQDYAVKVFGPSVAWDQSLHAMDYLEYAYLQRGQDADARRVLDQLLSFQKATPTTMAAGYAIAAIPVRFAVERQDWAAAAGLAIPPIAFPWDRFPWTSAMISYGRALGAAHMGDFAAAQAEIGRLQSAKEAAVASNNAYWAGQIDGQIQAAKAVLAFAEGRKDEALAEMRAAADAEDAADKNNVTPGPVLPARELLGDMLLNAQQPALALAEYERSLRAAPNRFRSLAGAGSAAEQMGDTTKARLYREQLLQVGTQADRERPELQAAKLWLEKG